MFRVCAIGVIAVGLLTASAVAQQPGGPQMFQPSGPMPMMMAPGHMQPAMFQGQGPVAPAIYESQGWGPAPVEQVGFNGPCQKGCAGPCQKSCGPGCQGCDSCCPPPCTDFCPPPGCPVWFNAEIEASILFMNLDGNTVVGSMASPSVPVFATYTSQDPQLDDDVTLVPRIWLHAQKCEWGFGGRLWYLSDSRSEFTPLNLLDLDIIGDYSMERLWAWTADAEVTYSFHLSHCHNFHVFSGSSFQMGLGLRYARLETDAVALGAARLDDAIASTTGVAATEFDGVGFTAGIRGTKHLWKHVSLYGNVRQSIIFGDMLVRAQTSASAIDDVALVAAADARSAGALSDEELMITEFQVGLQWEHPLKCFPACAFFRVAGEYQLWDIDSLVFAEANSQVQIDVLPGPQATIATSDARAAAPNLDLFGLTIAAGLTW